MTFGINQTIWNCRENKLNKLIKLFSTLFGAIENVLYEMNKFNLGVVNIRLKIKAQIIRFISRLLNWKALADYFLGQ